MAAFVVGLTFESYIAILRLKVVTYHMKGDYMSDLMDAGASMVEESSVTESTETGAVETPEGSTEESFDDLIKGKYKEEYGKHVKDAVNKRFKNQKDFEAKYNTLTPVLQMVAKKYGLEGEEIDVDGLAKAISDDNSMYEDEAFKAGMDVNTFKQMKQMEMENASLKRQQAEYDRQEQGRREWAALMDKAEEVKQIYPDFDLDAEMMNEGFGRLVAVGVPLQTVYEVIHKDEILASGMQYAVQNTSRKLANSIRAGARPTEGNVSPAAAVPSQDPSKLTKRDFEDIKSRVQRGEKIYF